MSDRQWQFGDWCEYDGLKWRVFAALKDGTLRVVDRSNNSCYVRVCRATYLPGCTGWDWQPPAPIDPGEGWRLLEKGELVDDGDEYYANGWFAHNLKPLSKQASGCTYRRRITPPLQLHEGAWYERRDGKVVGPCKRSYTNLVNFPWQVGEYAYTNLGFYWSDGSRKVPADLIREVPAPEPAYRHFANAEEYKPHRERWLRVRAGKLLSKAGSYDDCGIYASDGSGFKSFPDLFSDCEFEDETPFGIKE